MNYKIEGAIKRNRKNFIIFGILWLFIAIVFVAPLAYGSHVAGANGNFDLAIFMETFVNSETAKGGGLKSDNDDVRQIFVDLKNLANDMKNQINQ